MLDGVPVNDYSGSSPLARGPPANWIASKPKVGLIPARAGTTRRSARTRSCTWAHPRSRGDHLEPNLNNVAAAGSSPLARGPQKAVYTPGHLAGLIPARAGTTRHCCRRSSARRAHPRSRGDHLLAVSGMALSMGSSPLARGPRMTHHHEAVPTGLIPARAGTTHFYPPYRRTLGSSPLARGPRSVDVSGTNREGLIPARAGTTYSSFSA